MTSGKSCYFCAMLASRGPVYKNRESAGTRKVAGENEVHRYHDHCNCSVEPVYSRNAAWPDSSRRYEQLWKDSTGGKAGPEAIKAFREALTAA